MAIERHARLFRNGRNQAIRIPRDMELPGVEVVLRQEGNRLVIEPMQESSLLALLARLEPLEENMPDVDNSLPPLDDIAL